MSRAKKYSERDIIIDITEKNREVEDSITQKEYHEIGDVGIQTVINRFGSWNEAKKVAGLSTNAMGQGRNSDVVDKNREEIIEYIREGLSWKDIAKKLNYSYEHFCNCLSKSDIKVLNKLTRSNKSNFIISLVEEDLKKAGFNPEKTIYFDKTVNDGSITLELTTDRVKLERD